MRLVHHGDFDAGGLRIATLLVDRFGAQPWRMDTRSYRAAPAGPPLAGPVDSVGWAPGLAEAMNERSVAVHEEQVLDELIDDLRCEAAGAARASYPRPTQYRGRR